MFFAQLLAALAISVLAVAVFATAPGRLGARRHPVFQTGTGVVGLLLVVLFAGCSEGDSIVRAPGVDEADVDSIAVTPATAQLDQVGQTQLFTATPLAATGDTLDIEVAWSSSDIGVATMDPTGEATAQGPGQADITASVGNVTGRSVLSVSPVLEP